MYRKDVKCRRIAIPQLNCLDAGEHCTSHALVFTARRYANAVFAMTFCPSVCHKSVLCQNGYTDQAGFGNYPRLILHCALREFR